MNPRPFGVRDALWLGAVCVLAAGWSYSARQVETVRDESVQIMNQHYKRQTEIINEYEDELRECCPDRPAPSDE